MTGVLLVAEAVTYPTPGPLNWIESLHRARSIPVAFSLRQVFAPSSVFQIATSWNEHWVPGEPGDSHQPSPALMNATYGLRGSGGRAAGLHVSPRLSETKRWSPFRYIQTTPPLAAAI